MYTFYVLLFFILLMVTLGIIEFHRHQKRITKIPIRIHVNGTRGKSSVTRLIGAGLRNGGLKIITKVTGTYPRLILEDGNETAIYRKSGANILEQLGIVRFAEARNADALIIECMALQPHYQWVTENQMVHATIGVMTNVRLDHCDVMGYTIESISESMGHTIPTNGYFFTAETDKPQYLKQIADRKKSKMLVTYPHSVTDTEMDAFSYIEHKENVALALEICEHLGVNRALALQGMHQAIPDEGVLKRFQVKNSNCNVTFYNAFAANDPDSSFMIWNKLKLDRGFGGQKCVLLNTRHDRLDRARQLVEMVSQRLKDEINYFILIGQSTEVVEQMSLSNGCPKEKIINIGWTSPQHVFDKIFNLAHQKLTIVGIGNMGGMGASVADLFEQRSIQL